jgi:hypothetical protein
MSYWAKTKKQINEMSINQEKNLNIFLMIYPNKKRERVNKSIWLLRKAGFVYFDMAKDGSPLIVKLKNVPVSLSKKEAHIISEQPWYLWFKYPECEENNADLRVQV